MTDRPSAERWAPVQGESGVVFPARIPWHIHERAHGVYARRQPDQSAERIAVRGGFSVSELVACLIYGEYSRKAVERVTGDDIKAVRDEIEAWTSGMTALRQERDEARAALHAMREAVKLLAADIAAAARAEIEAREADRTRTMASDRRSGR